MVPIGFPLGYGRWGHAYANCLNFRFLCVCLHYGLWGIKEQPQPWDGQVAPCSSRVSWMSHRPGGDWMRSLWIPSNLRCRMIPSNIEMPVAVDGVNRAGTGAYICISRCLDTSTHHLHPSLSEGSRDSTCPCPSISQRGGSSRELLISMLCLPG